MGLSSQLYDTYDAMDRLIEEVMDHCDDTLGRSKASRTAHLATAPSPPLDLRGGTAVSEVVGGADAAEAVVANRRRDAGRVRRPRDHLACNVAVDAESPPLDGR